MNSDIGFQTEAIAGLLASVDGRQFSNKRFVYEEIHENVYDLSVYGQFSPNGEEVKLGPTIDQIDRMLDSAEEIIAILCGTADTSVRQINLDLNMKTGKFDLNIEYSKIEKRTV
jgi:hypothetical protein